MALETMIHIDETAPKRERWRVLRAIGGDPGDIATRWQTMASFGTEREAQAFMAGVDHGAAYAPAPEPLDDRLSEALRLVKLARDDYRDECRRLRAMVAEMRSEVAA